MCSHAEEIWAAYVLSYKGAVIKRFGDRWRWSFLRRMARHNVCRQGGENGFPWLLFFLSNKKAFPKVLLQVHLGFSGEQASRFDLCRLFLEMPLRQWRSRGGQMHRPTAKPHFGKWRDKDKPQCHRLQNSVQYLLRRCSQGEKRHGLVGLVCEYMQ